MVLKLYNLKCYYSLAGALIYPHGIGINHGVNYYSLGLNFNFFNV